MVIEVSGVQFGPKLHDPKFNCHFILKSHNLIAWTQTQYHYILSQ